MGQMSLWGGQDGNPLFMPLLESCQLLSVSTKFNLNLLEKFVGILDGDGYIEIGPQKQSGKSTIRIRIVLRLHEEDKELLNFFVNCLKIGKIDKLKSVNQYRLIIFKTDIFNIIFPYLQSNNIEFLTYNRRKQFFLYKYILENKIVHWENINLEKINKLFILFNFQSKIKTKIVS